MHQVVRIFDSPCTRAGDERSRVRIAPQQVVQPFRNAMGIIAVLAEVIGKAHQYQLVGDPIVGAPLVLGHSEAPQDLLQTALCSSVMNRCAELLRELKVLNLPLGGATWWL